MTHALVVVERSIRTAMAKKLKEIASIKKEAPQCGAFLFRSISTSRKQFIMMRSV
jgi:hypothetical protein